MLRALKLKPVYETEGDDLLRDFYIPALGASVSYDRAVGFFSGAMLSFAAQGLSAFIARNDGHMRLIIGGELDEEDVAAIERGYEARALAEKVGRSLTATIDAIDDDLFQTRVELLAWLVAAGRLDIKVALKRRGMFHSKIGILRDLAGDSIVFQGSANETAHALLPDFNYESINVFPSWREQLAEHATPHIASFERLWGNRSSKAIVIAFPDAARDRLISIAKKARVATPEVEESVWRATIARYQPRTEARRTPKVPDVLGGRSFAIMQHQREALEAWRARHGQAILELATGSGKTITAAYAMVRLFESSKRLCVVVAVPYQNLADQWVEALLPFSISAYPCYGGLGRWLDDVSSAVHLFDQGALSFLCLVVVNRSLSSVPFQLVLNKLSTQDMMFVGDECHRHATAGMADKLPEAKLRLGLSATPDDHRDDGANRRLHGHYGETAFRYGLKQALDDGVLTPYRYHVHLVDLTEAEAERYTALADEIAAQVARSGGDLDTGNTALERLLFERARLLGGASAKLPKLMQLLGPEPVGHTLFYCSDASVLVDDEEHENAVVAPQRQVEAVSELLHRRRWRNARFTSREGLRERREILDRFRLGEIDALVAIRCLDEGIDVPACHRAYILASSRNPRQFIQRRGRILRRAPGKEQADIYDIMARLPEGATSRELERRLLVEEFKRVSEFARLARNAGETVDVLMPLMRRYDLVHHLV